MMQVLRNFQAVVSFCKGFQIHCTTQAQINSDSLKEKMKLTAYMNAVKGPLDLSNF